MIELFKNISNEFLGLILILNIIFAISIAWLLICNKSKTNILEKKYNKFMSGLSDVNIEELLYKCLDDIKSLKNENIEVNKNINTIERNLIPCIQKVSIIRFNAFENVGSDLSYSIALLDNNNDGVVLSSIFTRESSVTYAKPILSGNSKHNLSAEEIQVLDMAKKNHNEKLYVTDK